MGLAGTGLGVATKLSVGFGALGLLGGTVAGATVARPVDDAPAVVAGRLSDAGSASLFDCPDGSVVGSLQVGDRVFVVGRDEAGDWLALRNPRDVGEKVWIPSGTLTPDNPDHDDVPVVSCDGPDARVGEAGPDELAESTTTTTDPSSSTTSSSSSPTTSSPASNSSSTTAKPTTAPTTAKPTTAKPTTSTTAESTTTSSSTTTTQPPDTQKPTIQVSGFPTKIFYDAQPGCAATSTITAFVDDNVGVTSVTGSYSGWRSGSINFSGSGGTRTGTLGPFAGVPLDYADHKITVTVTVRDAAGNLNTDSLDITVGYCLV